MIIIPAIDIRQGKCVMLTQGNIEKETIFSNDPVFMAKMWQAKGASRLHVIDLDGAFCGVPQNWEIIEQIRKSFTGLMEVGGGVRNLATIKKLLNIGIDRVIVATVMVYNPKEVKKAMEKFNGKIIAAIDVLDGKVAIGGWKEVTEINALDMIKKMEETGIEEVIVTDILRDGTLEGVNFDDLKTLSSSTAIKIIASGGVGSMDDIRKLKEIEKYGITGVIIGKALYNESVKYEEAVKLMQEK